MRFLSICCFASLVSAVSFRQDAKVEVKPVLEKLQLPPIFFNEEGEPNLPMLEKLLNRKNASGLLTGVLGHDEASATSILDAVFDKETGRIHPGIARELLRPGGLAQAFEALELSREGRIGDLRPLKDL